MSLSPIPIRVLHKVCNAPCLTVSSGKRQAGCLCQPNVTVNSFSPNLWVCLLLHQSTKSKKTPVSQSTLCPLPNNNQIASCIGPLKVSKNAAVCLLQTQEHNAEQYFCIKGGAQTRFIKICSLHCLKARAAWPQAQDSKRNACAMQNDITQILEKLWTHQYGMLIKLLCSASPGSQVI